MAPPLTCAQSTPPTVAPPPRRPPASLVLVVVILPVAGSAKLTVAPVARVIAPKLRVTPPAPEVTAMEFAPEGRFTPASVCTSAADPPVTLSLPSDKYNPVVLGRMLFA